MTRLFSFMLVLSGAIPALALTKTTIYGPPGSEAFGYEVAVLPNGNIVVTDPYFDRQSPTVTDAGAVYLLRPDGTLVSRIVGSTASDEVGNGGVEVLSNGNFVVMSPDWQNGSGDSVGAATFGDADTGFGVGVASVVTSNNSLVGSNHGDAVGIDGIVELTNGDYLVRSRTWNGYRGAVTWGDGEFGVSGVVSSSNSVVGASASDNVGMFAPVVLLNGHYVIPVPLWDNGAAADAGAARWCRGGTPATGTITTGNSLVGTTAGDRVGDTISFRSPTRNALILSPNWDNGAAVDAGAATWMDGEAGLTGSVSATNSVVGSSTGDRVGMSALLLTNRNFVVISQLWDNGATVDVGAATWMNGLSGGSGVVSPANSMIGSSADDRVSAEVLLNGHYVMVSPNWDNGAIANVGAVTWVDGTGPASGVVSTANSLFGTTADDKIGNFGVFALPNGNYVVASALWDNGGIMDAGAVTWCKGSGATIGSVGPSNSLFGGTAMDQVGTGVTVLSNGNYVVRSPNWDNGSATNAGAATWGNGTKGVKGLVSKSNSLVGSRAGDAVGTTITGLRFNGNYVVRSPTWDNGSIVDAGAATWAKGTTGIKGTISAANSLVGAGTGDKVGLAGVMGLQNGNYVVQTPEWSGAIGAVTWGSGTFGVKGTVSGANSLIGAAPADKVGSSSIVEYGNGDYVVASPLFAPGGALTLCNGSAPTSAVVCDSNSILGTNPGDLNGIDPSFNPSRGQAVVPLAPENLVVLLGSYLPTSLAKTGDAAPGATDIAFSTTGFAAVNDWGGIVFDSTLTGAGSKSGRNRALFDVPPGSSLPTMILQTGDPLFALGVALPMDAKATAVTSQVCNQFSRSLFQATISGTGIKSSDNRLLLLDSGAEVTSLLRTGQPVSALGGARVASFKEVLQSDESDLVVLGYGLATSGTGAATGSTDTGILALDHGGGVIGGNGTAREGSPAFGVGGGTFGQFNARSAAGYEVIHFSASFKPASGSAGEAIFRMNKDGSNAARVVLAGDTPPDIVGDPDVATVKFSSFPAISQQVGGLSENVIFKAILKSGDATRNEGLWMLPHTDIPADQRILRKGDQVTGLPAGVVFKSIQKFWPADNDQVFVQATISGPGVTSGNNVVLMLRQEDGSQVLLMRTGDTLPAIGTAKIKSISAVEVASGSGTYAILTTLSNAPSSSNQALWTGCTSFGSPVNVAPRKPVLRLRKGDRYGSSQTESAVVKSMTLKPFIDSSGAGNRGLSRCVGFNGSVAVYVLIDRNVTELILLPSIFTAV